MKRHLLGTAAKQREAWILNYIHNAPNSYPTVRDIYLDIYSDDFETAEFRDLCNDTLIFDFIRVALIDLRTAGLLKLDQGWELTEKGTAIVCILNSRPDAKFVYIASPYSTDDAQQQHKWVADVAKVVDHLTETDPNTYAFSPVLYSHPIGRRGSTPVLGWYDWDFIALERADELRVLMLADWQKSEGIALEIRFAEEHGIPITYTTVEEALCA